MDQSPLDPAQILADLREERRRLAWEPLPPARLAEPWDRPGVAGLESLAYLHRHWKLEGGSANGDSAHERGGARHQLERVGRGLVARLLTPSLFRERNLRAKFVQTVDALAWRLDELTQRVEELVDADAARQAAEARRLAELAAWLHTAVPGAPQVGGSPVPGCTAPGSDGEPAPASTGPR